MIYGTISRDAVGGCFCREIGNSESGYRRERKETSGGKAAAQEAEKKQKPAEVETSTLASAGNRDFFDVEEASLIGEVGVRMDDVV